MGAKIQARTCELLCKPFGTSLCCSNSSSRWSHGASSYTDGSSWCFVQTVLPNGVAFSPEYCNTIVCDPDFYPRLSACLNCIVANGDERPFGYYTNTSITVEPTYANSDQSFPSNPNGLVDADQANAILRNVTERCAAIGSTVVGESTITAVPTTT
jgi:hypothetical protein